MTVSPSPASVLVLFLSSPCPGRVSSSLPEIPWGSRSWAVFVHRYEGHSSTWESWHGIYVREASSEDAFHNRVLGILFFPGVMSSPPSFAVLLGSYVPSPFSCPSSSSSFLLLFLCHSWCIHASLATSHCGRNRFHLWIDFNSLLQASSQGCTDSATLGTGSALTDSKLCHSEVWWWEGERCKKTGLREAFLRS